MTNCNVVGFFFRETWFKLSGVSKVKLMWKRLLIILIMGHKRQNNYPILTTQCHDWSETYTFNGNTGSSYFNCQKPSKYSNLSRHLWCIDTVNIDTHAWHMKHCTSNIHNQSGWKLSQRLSQSHCNKLNKTEMTTLTHKAKTDLCWLVLTQSLEVLHCSLVALQRRVGLGGLVQQHLQSCERGNRVTGGEREGSESKCEISLMESRRMSSSLVCAALHNPSVDRNWTKAHAALIGGREQLVWIGREMERPSRTAWYHEHKLQRAD